MEKYNDNFATVTWCNEDIEDALEFQDCEVTEENVLKIRKALDNHFFTDFLIEKGWDYIYNIIDTELN